MGRKKTVINPKSGKRLSSLLKSQNMSQKALAEKLSYTPQQISRIVNSKERLTEEFARRVVCLFENGNIIDTVRVEWLMGYDNFETEGDRIDFIVTKREERATLIQRLVELHGYDVSVEKEFVVERKEDKQAQKKAIQKALSEWSESSCHLQYPAGISDEDILKRVHNNFPEAVIEVRAPNGPILARYIERREYLRILQNIDDYIEMQLSFLFHEFSNSNMVNGY